MTAILAAWANSSRRLIMSEAALPLARTQRLLVEELDDEVVVYDLDSDSAHLLNATLVAVWRRCDGRTTVGEAVAALGGEADEHVVWEAVAQLESSSLLQEAASPPVWRMSRRQVLRRVGIAAVAAPVIVTVFAAEPAAAASAGIPNGGTCTGATGPQKDASCASGRCVGTTCATCAPAGGNNDNCSAVFAGKTCNNTSGHCN